MRAGCVVGVGLLLACRPASAPVSTSPPASSIADAELQELHALAELTGLVRFFHPSDEAAAVPWDLFVVHAAAELLSEPGRQDDRLAELFAPVAPTVQLASSPDALLPAVLPEGDGRVVAWGHLGVAPDRPDAELHLSFRTHRPSWHQPEGGWTRLRQELFLDTELIADRAVAEEVRERTVRVEWGLRAEHPEVVVLGLNASSSDGTVLASSDGRAWLPGAGDRLDTTLSLVLPPETTQVELTLFCRPQREVRVEAVSVTGLESDPEAVRALPLRLADEDGHGWTQEGYEHRPIPADGPLWLAGLGEPRDELPFQPDTALGDAVVEELAPGLFARVPLALPTDAQATLPRGSADLVAWRAALVRLSAEDRSRPEVRVATVIQLWVLLRHLFPYRESVTESWDSLLDRSLVEARATDAAGLEGVLERMLLPLHDGHAWVSDHLAQSPTRCPLALQEAEGRIFVTASGLEDLQVGDELLTIEGEPVQQRLSREEARISGSPQWKRSKALSQLRTTSSGRWTAEARRDGLPVAVSVDCATSSEAPRGEDVRELGDGFVYVDMRSRRWGTAEKLARIQDARGVVVDLRGYPGLMRGVQHLLLSSAAVNDEWNRPLQLSRPDAHLPGPAAGGLVPMLRSDEAAPVVWLTDGGAISAGETVLMAARAGKQTILGATPTAGADGELRWFALMGTWRVGITGTVAQMMDGTPLWRVGIVPDIRVPLTPEALAKGEDEVLAAAILQLRKEVAERP